MIRTPEDVVHACPCLRYHRRKDGRISYRYKMKVNGKWKPFKLGVVSPAMAYEQYWSHRTRLQEIESAKQLLLDYRDDPIAQTYLQQNCPILAKAAAETIISLTVAQLVEQYLEDLHQDLIRNGASNEGWRAAKTNLQRIETAVLEWGARQANSVKDSDIIDLIGKMKQVLDAKGALLWKTASIRHSMETLRTVYNFGIDQDPPLVIKNPILEKTLDKLLPRKKIREEAPKVIILHPRYDEALLRAATTITQKDRTGNKVDFEGTRRMRALLPALILLALDCGVRQDGIVNISRIEDLELEKELIRIEILKGERRERREKEWRYLFLLRTLRAVERALTYSISVNSPHLFPSPDPAKHMSGETARRWFILALQAAGLPLMEYHWLKHTFVTRAKCVQNRELVRAYSSHKDAGVHENTYNHLTSREGMLQHGPEMIEPMQEFLSRNGGWTDALTDEIFARVGTATVVPATLILPRTALQ